MIDFFKKYKFNYLLISFWSLFILFNAFFSINKKLIEFDSIMYVASLLKYEIADYRILHQQTYNELKNFVDKSTFEELTTKYPYRNSVYQNSNYFMQQLPFYEIRPLYILLIYALYKIGFNIYFAIIFLSALASSMGLIFIFSSLYQRIHPIFLFILPLVIFSFKFLEVTSLGTPDSLFFLITSIVLYLFLNNKFKLMFILFPISVAVRTDTIIFAIVFIITFLIMYKKEYLYSLISLTISFFVLFIINRVSNNYGWNMIFYFSFIARIPNPAEIQPLFTFKEYSIILIKNFLGALHYPPFLLYINYFLINIILIFLRKETLQDRKIILLFIVSFLYIFLHYLGFPAVWSRFFIGFYIYNLIVTILIIDQIFSNKLTKSKK